MSNALAIATMDKETIERVKAHCVRIANSGLVPEHFSKNPSAIYTAIDMARALGEEPVTLMQHIYFVSGRAGLSAAYMLSRMRRRGVIKGTVRYETTGKGEALSVRAYAIEAETGKEVNGPEVSMEMAKAEGWVKNAKYKSMPEVMLRKRAITFLVRDHFPDVLMGMLLVDELEDMRASRVIDATAVPSGDLADLNAEVLGEQKPIPFDEETGEVLEGAANDAPDEGAR